MTVKNIALTNWYISVRRSAAALVSFKQHESVRMYDHTSVQSCLGTQCSLVISQHGGTVEANFVSWVRPIKNLQGRVVSLDESGCIIYPSNFLPALDFRQCLMVLPSIGAKVRKQSREEVSNWMVRLRDMINIAADGGDEVSLSTSLPKCGLCTESHAPMFRCPFCMHHYHRRCTEQLFTGMTTFQKTTTVQFITALDTDFTPQDILAPILYPVMLPLSFYFDLILCFVFGSVSVYLCYDVS